MGPLIDLTGKRFGRLTVLKRGPDLVEKRGGIRVMWICRCDCGKKVTVRSRSLLTGNTQSCGCLQQDIVVKRHKESGTTRDKTVTRYINKCKRSAVKRGLKFNLTREQIASLIFQDCHYCGRKPEQSFGRKNTLPYNGLDRMDSDKGYTIENVVPCCGSCNTNKRRTLYDIFAMIMNKGIKTFSDPEA